jgi:hypothetical protein
MNINRRELMLPALALGLLSVIPASMVPAFAGADEDAVAKNLEAFRAAQAVGNAEAIAGLCAAELSYSHSSGAVDDKASLLAGVTNAKYKWTSLEYKNPRSVSSVQPPSCASTLSASRNLRPTARKFLRTCTS